MERRPESSAGLAGVRVDAARCGAGRLVAGPRGGGRCGRLRSRGGSGRGLRATTSWLGRLRRITRVRGR